VSEPPTAPPTIPLNISAPPVTDLQRDIVKMGQVVQVLESWFGAVILLIAWKSPRNIDIQVASREDFDKCRAAMNLTTGRLYGQVDSPLINATGEFNGLSVYLYGRA